jgi:hypothetical protein
MGWLRESEKSPPDVHKLMSKPNIDRSYQTMFAGAPAIPADGAPYAAPVLQAPTDGHGVGTYAAAPNAYIGTQNVVCQAAALDGNSWTQNVSQPGYYGADAWGVAGATNYPSDDGGHVSATIWYGEYVQEQAVWWQDWYSSDYWHPEQGTMPASEEEMTVWYASEHEEASTNTGGTSSDDASGEATQDERAGTGM